QELSALLAQSRQRTKVVEEQLTAVREQLTSTTSQLAKVRQEKEVGDKQVQAMQASMKRRGNVTIPPNSSYQKPLVAISVPGVDVRTDEDVVRIVLPANQIFEPNTVRLRSGAERIITTVANEITRNYPRNRIGIEGHTDSAPVVNKQWNNNHEFSAGRAMAVYNVLIQQARMNPTQLFVAAHGSNHPAYSTGPPGGLERNRRVELVVYPEKYTQ
ncbi:MAG: OmpA family protein, partial [Planctomycetota bacterium]|nr:OmpA family protein [Planctomycetota bacterium]